MWTWAFEWKIDQSSNPHPWGAPGDNSGWGLLLYKSIHNFCLAWTAWCIAHVTCFLRLYPLSCRCRRYGVHNHMCGCFEPLDPTSRWLDPLVWSFTWKHCMAPPTIKCRWKVEACMHHVRVIVSLHVSCGRPSCLLSSLTCRSEIKWIGPSCSGLSQKIICWK